MIRVAIVDDHQVFREALKLLIEAHKDLTVVAEVADAQTACDVLEREKPDVALIDLSLRGGSGITVVRDLHRRQLPVRALVLTASTASEQIGEAVLAGARGVALKSQGGVDLIAAIRAVHAGEEYFGPDISRAMLSELKRSNRMPGPLAHLSPREREIFDLIVATRSNREIAEDLRISVKTVETHRASINRKLDVHA